MQNKANLPDTEISANFFDKRDYENKSAFAVQKNKANQTQFQTQKQLTLLARREIARGALRGFAGMTNRWFSFCMGALSLSSRLDARCAIARRWRPFVRGGAFRFPSPILFLPLQCRMSGPAGPPADVALQPP